MSEHSNTPETPAIQPRHVFSSLPKYAAGKPPTPVEGLKQYKLSSNENPHGPIPEVARILAEFDATHRYPDPLSTKLRTALAHHLGVDAHNIVTGAGSLGALNQILKAFAGASLDGTQDEVIYAWRSFEAYPILVGLLGAKSVQIPNLPNGAHDLNAMAQAVTDRTRVILVCTPNNPTGPAVTEAQMREFLTKIPENVVVVIDEAYYEFCTASTVPAGQNAPRERVEPAQRPPERDRAAHLLQSTGARRAARGLLRLPPAADPVSAGCGHPVRRDRARRSRSRGLY